MHAGRHQPGFKQQQEEQSTPSPLSLLPTDLLGQVFKRFPAATYSAEEPRTDPSSLSARATCRWLRDAFDSCNTHLMLVGSAAAGSKDSAQRRSYHALLERLIARTSSLSSLRIKDWENGRELLKLPVPWGRLKQLDLSELRQLQYSASGKPKLQAFGPLAHCSSLEELGIFSGSLFMSKPNTLPFRSTLRNLGLIQPSNSDLGGLAPLFTALQQLVMAGCMDMLDLASIAACSGLRHLNLELNTFEDINGSLSSWTSLTQLTSLELCECGDLEDLRSIALLSSLRHLELKEAYKITDISPLVSLRSSLERLVIADGHDIAVPSLRTCLSSCTLLRHLDLSSCYKESSTSLHGGTLLLSALSACILLEHLDLGYCPVSGSLASLLPCTRLQRLYLRGGWMVTALAPLASLVELHVSYSHYAEPWDLSLLTTCTKLVCLNLNGCHGIRSLTPLSACKVLERLGIGRCNNLASLEPLGACTALKVLDLSHSDVPMDLAPLAACSALQQLDLYKCCSSMDLAPLQSCSRLEKLFLADPFYLAALSSLSHLTNLSIMEHEGSLV